MLTRRMKAAYYVVAWPAMLLSGVVYKALRAPRSGKLRVHLGPGQKTYLAGWINVDANAFTAKCDVWADLRNPLPFWDETVEAMYSHHVIEHLPDLRSHMHDVFRCLAPGGIYRLGVPNGDSAIAMFTAGRSDWFGDFPDKRRSVGGRFENFIFCRGEHLTVLTESYLRELLEDAGFVEIRSCVPTRETGRVDLFSDCLSTEWENDFEHPRTLLMEASKPE